jgi:hypothetical protein
MSIKLKAKGDFKKAQLRLKQIAEAGKIPNMDKYGKMGVEALSAATPVDSGLTAQSWGYEIKKEEDGVTIVWTNSNVNKGVNIAIILQYGHGTGTGGYVQGIDYINPALKPVFKQIADDAWKELTKK